MAGTPLKIGGREFQVGLGTHAPSEAVVNLKGSATRFEAVVGIDDNAPGEGEAIFEIWLDGKRLARTPVLKRGDEQHRLSVDVSGGQYLVLRALEGPRGGEHAHANWGDAHLTLKPDADERPQMSNAPYEPPRPIARIMPPARPRINGPRVVGTTPGRPFIFRVPATGEGELSFSAANLPAGLRLDSATGIISGAVQEAGQHTVTLQVSNRNGSDTRELRIEAGDGKLALTPPLGWNSWQIYAVRVTGDDIRRSADALIESGLAAHGFQYVCIDDGWEGARDPVTGELGANDKFGDMKALADYVHAKGLKIGIYSSPGPLTCQRFAGSYEHEQQDAATFARWGMDYLKYDLCSLKRMIDVKNLDAMQHPYRIMGDALRQQPRDIVYSLCQYGWLDVWKWGTAVGGNLWRTTDDIGDFWGTVAGNGFAESDHAQYAGPGHWNDPDMLVVGQLGPGWAAEVHPTLLTPNEQVTHITHWTMAAAPLILGCDLTRLDQWTLDLMTNDEVLAVNQDALGTAGRRVSRDGFLEVWSRPLEDGSLAVALFNRSVLPGTVTAKWSDLGVDGSRNVRDLWQQKDLGRFDGSFSEQLPGHGCVLLKLSK